MKSAAIVADNYKLEKFKKELNAKGFTEIKTQAFTVDTTTISVPYKDDAELKELSKICHLVELHFKRSN